MVKFRSHGTNVHAAISSYYVVVFSHLGTYKDCSGYLHSCFINYILILAKSSPSKGFLRDSIRTWQNYSCSDLHCSSHNCTAYLLHVQTYLLYVDTSLWSCLRTYSTCTLHTSIYIFVADVMYNCSTCVCTVWHLHIAYIILHLFIYLSLM